MTKSLIVIVDSNHFNVWKEHPDAARSHIDSAVTKGYQNGVKEGQKPAAFVPENDRCAVESVSVGSSKLQGLRAAATN